MSESHSAESIMRSVRGFMASRILLTGAELDLFTFIDRSRSVDFIGLNSEKVLTFSEYMPKWSSCKDTWLNISKKI
jgi:hypothetical protein